ncbi:hypothetical protein JCM10914A_19150 [Paenibacillus sp. JCM 10914]|uniref:YycH family regulatory protein n=1 Tax=Paenibacillus sp. JCM 10914 TaxID=1236974 RepID=UPI0003CC3E99|nr:two-component system activity regulator YycH [Paenibacillus sp. JCM 10914]GAE06207.1 YycH protein [Paenibacillus sp. JCM 10914]
MKERLKTFTLLVLVVSSLLQSYVLLFRFPGSDSVVQSKDSYIRTEEMGPEERADNLFFPDKMVIHLGEDQHTVFYPNDTFYNLVFNRLKGRTFDNFQRRMVANIDWNKIRAENRGIELSFQSGIPVTLLQRIMQIVPDSLFEGERIDKIWFYSIEGESKVHVMFFSTEGDVVYEAAQADLTVQDVDQLVDFGLNWMPYKMVEGRYYVPENELNMISVELPIGIYTTEQMQRSLFFDPSITRNIREKDGSEIYTDSKRSLQVDQGQNWISYTDPAAPPSGESNPGKDVLSAIDFVNQHGGWNGTYGLSRADESEDRTLVRFQQYYGGFPILNTPGFQYGVMELDLQKGTVTSYERSLLYLESAAMEKQMMKLTGGEELEAKLALYAEDGAIRGLDPVYLPVITEQGLLLKPVWAVELHNGAIVTVE